VAGAAELNVSPIVITCSEIFGPSDGKMITQAKMIGETAGGSLFIGPDKMRARRRHAGDAQLGQLAADAAI
jgi:hypothetical protein